MPKVTPIDYEALCYHVESSNDKQRDRRVELDIHNKAWECSCPGFSCVINPRIQKGEPLFIGNYPNERTMCRHIKEAYFYFAKAMLTDMSKIQNEGNK